MQLPFKKTTGATTDRVKDYDLKSHYPDINMNMEWVEINPYARQAIRSYLLPYIGSTLYDDIVDKIQAGDTLTTEESEFAERLKDVAAYYTVMVTLPKKKTVIASMGAVENAGADGTTTSSLWGFRTTLWAVAQDADRMMDELLAWMEEQVEGGSDYFTDNWQSTTAYDSVSTGFFRYVSEFQQYHSIHRSFRNFKRLVAIITECSERYILPLLCTDQYNALLTAIKENNPTAEQSALIHQVRRALAKWVIYEATQQIPYSAELEGFRIISNADAIDQKQYGDATIQQAIQGMRESAERSARSYTGDLEAFLYKNKADYPLWENSNCNKLRLSVPETSVYSHGSGGVFI